MSAANLLQAFLDDIVAHPEDPSLWLILADWLDEHEDPRGELVRLTWSLQHERDHADFAARQTRVQALLAAGLEPVVPRRSLDGFTFAWLPPGSFVMGSPADEPGHEDDEVQHPVTLTRPFWMGTHLVTQAQWQAVLGDNPSTFSRQGAHRDRVKKVADADLERYPVDHVSWNMAHGFCAVLGQRLGRPLRLPTEAEWEYACRAGTTTAFHCGPVLESRHAHCDGIRRTRPARHPTVVGSFPPNAWGLYDLHGNLWEWCEDSYVVPYDPAAAVDPLVRSDTAGGPVLRGGSWLGSVGECRSASRTWSRPVDQSLTFGVRICFSA